MKKLMMVFLSLALVLGLSSISMAVALDNAQLEVNVQIQPNAHMAIVTNDFTGATTNNTLKGLFNYGFDVTGDPGFYISDGNATKDFAVSQWSPNPNMPVNSFDDDSVEMIAIDANTDVRLTMSSTFSSWPAEVPVFFRLSSDAGIADTYNNGLVPAAGFGPNGEELTGDTVSYNTITQQGSLDRAKLGVYTGQGFGAWGNDLAVIANNDSLSMNDGLGQSDYVDLEFRKCTPYLIHINGGLYLDKVGVVEAGTYSETIDFVIEAI